MKIERWFAEREDIEGYNEDKSRYVTVEDGYKIMRKGQRAMLIETYDGIQVWVPYSVIDGGEGATE
jgi:hypothetical protein